MSRRLEILRRATEVFQRQGFAGTSIEDIGRAVGIKREGIYYYFRSKEEMLLEIILPQSNSLLLTMRSIMRSNTSATEKLQSALQNHLDSFNPAYLEMIVALREGHSFKNDDKLRELRRIWRQYSDLWVALVEEGQQRGEFRSGYNPQIVAYGILGMCNWLSRWYDPAKGVALDEIIRTYLDMVLHGMALPQAATATTERAWEPG
ncbi:MAG: TetR/AcrR family transcriptional regulator [Rhodospirillales bacterium]|nr:TetR/AcrR family transcriptional regulator [Rhodospirillales bacterium]